MEVARTTGLPLKPVPVVRESEERKENVVHEGVKSDRQVVGDEMWVILDSIPDEFLPCLIICSSHVCPAREVSVKVLPLHIGRAKRHENG